MEQRHEIDDITGGFALLGVLDRKCQWSKPRAKRVEWSKHGNVGHRAKVIQA